MSKIEVYGIKIEGEIEPGTDIARTVVENAERYGYGISDSDIIVVTSKIVSKAEGRMYKLLDVKPSRKASRLSKHYGIQPETMELHLKAGKIMAVIPVERLSRKYGLLFEEYARDKIAAQCLLKENPYLFLTDVNGQLLTDGGIDFSNCPPGFCTLLPEDPDGSARNIKEGIRELAKKNVAVVIADSDFRPDKFGTTDIAIGSAGIQPVTKRFADQDLYGKPKFGGIDDLTNLVSASANLVIGQTTEATPLAIVRGFRYEESDKGVSDVVHSMKSQRLHTPFGALSDRAYRKAFYSFLWESAKFWILSRLF